MRWRSKPDLLRGLILATALWSLSAVGPARAELGRSETLAYERWLEAGALLSPSSDLYPDIPEEAFLPGIHLLDRRVLAARAMVIRQETIERAWDRREFEDENQSLNTARALRELGDYDAALGWYRTARHNRRSLTADPDLDAELFACAVLTADSLSIFEELLSLAGRSDLERRDAQIVLAFRHYAGRRDAGNLEFLRRKLEGRLDGHSTRVRFWYAYTLANAGGHTEALPIVRGLVIDPVGPGALEPWQAAWVARALPDLLLVAGRTADAFRLYELLADADVDGLNGRWARYQLGGRELLSGAYVRAAEIYRESCAGETEVPWRQRACTLAAAAEQLESIRKEGERHGTDGIHSR